MKTAEEKAIDIFGFHQGFLRTSQAIQLGISPRTLYAMRDKGLIRQVSRGVFQLASLELPANLDWVGVALRIPRAVICLISALFYYELSTQIPHKVYIALPQPAEKPRLDFPPLDIIWLSEKVYNAGIEEHTINGMPVKIYSREKTIADCFKFRNKIGMETTLEALKDYLKQPNRQLDSLLGYARIDQVEKLVLQYLEVLL